MSTSPLRVSSRQLGAAAVCVALLAVCSWISIPAPVPFTLQTFAVLLLCDLLDGALPMLTILAYLLLGALGVPVFAEFSGGLGSLLGPTGGYLFGFLLSALLLSLWKRRFGRRLRAPAMALALLACYLPGTCWFVLVYAWRGQAVSFGAAFTLCVLPYLLPDAVKLALACLVSDRLRPLLP